MPNVPRNCSWRMWKTIRILQGGENKKSRVKRKRTVWSEGGESKVSVLLEQTVFPYGISSTWDFIVP